MTFEDPKDRTGWMDALFWRLREHGLIFRVFLVTHFRIPLKKPHQDWDDYHLNCSIEFTEHPTAHDSQLSFFQIWIFKLEEFLSPRSTCHTRVCCPDGVQEDKFREVRWQMDVSSDSHGSHGTL